MATAATSARRYAGPGTRPWPLLGTRRAEEGTATVETAIALVAVTVVIGLLAGVVVLGTTQLAVSSAAGVGARAAARGEPLATARAAASSAAGAPVQVRVRRADRWTTVVVTRAVRLPLPGRPALTVRGRAVALTEDTG